MMTLNNHYHYVEILSPWGFRKRFSSHIHTSNPNEQSVKKTFVCNCQHLAKAGDERMKWTMALDSFQFFFQPQIIGDEGGKASWPGPWALGRRAGVFNSLTPWSRKSFQRELSPGKSKSLLANIYFSLIPCKVVFFLKIKSKKAFQFLFAWTTSKQPYLLSLFLMRVAQHLWSWLNWFHS